jgi:hypothetical protein
MGVSPWTLAPSNHEMMVVMVTVRWGKIPLKFSSLFATLLLFLS